MVEWQCKNEASIHRWYRTAKHFSIEVGGGGGRDRERKCRISRISTPPALCTKAKVAKGGGEGVFAGHYGIYNLYINIYK